MCDLGSKHGAVITKPAPPTQAPSPALVIAAVCTAEAKSDATAKPTTMTPAKKFFPIPIPREPERVAGAHGDRITLGKTTMVVEREGGAKPPPAKGRGRRGSRRQGARGGAGAVVRSSARSKAPPAVISKGFTVNPNLVRLRVCRCVLKGGVEGGGSWFQRVRPSDHDRAAAFKLHATFNYAVLFV